MLRDLVDRQMQSLDLWERTLAELVANESWWDDLIQAQIRHIAEDLEDRVALILDPKSHPDRWLFELVELLVSVEDDDIRAMAQKSEAAGNPPLGFEFVVSCQITAALLRGHLIPAEA